MKIYEFDSINSTNEYARELIREGKANHFDVVISKEQTEGFGRGKKEFISPVGGLYFSILLDKGELPQGMSPVWAAAVCVSSVISDLYDVETGIKWVNDILVDKKKVCGVIALTTDKSEFIILGIGINVNTDKEYFRGIRHIDSLKSITHKMVDEHKIFTECLAGLKQLLGCDLGEIMLEYRKRCMTIGSDVKSSINGRDIYGMAVDVCDSGELMIIADNGETIMLNSGEVRTRDGKYI